MTTHEVVPERSSEERLKRYPLVQADEPVSGRFVTITVPGRQDPEWETFAEDPDKWVQDIIRAHGFEINAYYGDLRTRLSALDETGAQNLAGGSIFHVEYPTREHSKWIWVERPW